MTSIKELTNIIDTLIPPTTFNKNEKRELTKLVVLLLTSYVEENPFEINLPNFHDTMIKDVFELLHMQLVHMYDYDIEDDINVIIHKGCKQFYSTFMPRRSYNKSFIRCPANIGSMTNKLNILKNLINNIINLIFN